jgi:hypothetical protein
MTQSEIIPRIRDYFFLGFENFENFIKTGQNIRKKIISCQSNELSQFTQHVLAKIMIIQLLNLCIFATIQIFN